MRAPLHVNTNFTQNIRRASRRGCRLLTQKKGSLENVTLVRFYLR